MKFSMRDFFSKCDQIRSFLRIWLHLLKKSFMENFIFVEWIFIINVWRAPKYTSEITENIIDIIFVTAVKQTIQPSDILSDPYISAFRLNTEI